MSNLPFDIITNILSRLPAKSLQRFKCVSKPWNSQINDPKFIKTHLDLAVQANHLNIMLRDSFLYSLDHESSFRQAKCLDYPYKTNNGGVEILGSCNGLLCISVLVPKEDDAVICIWNPCTQEFSRVPSADIEFPGGFGVCEKILYGFGYDRADDDYKVVRLIMFYGEGDRFESEVRVYSLRTDSWKRVGEIPFPILYKRVFGVYVDGALHWVATRKPESDLSKVIVSFDVVDQVFKEVPQPDYEDDEFHLNVGELGGCLCVLANFYKVLFQVWVMKGYGVKDSWTKMFSISQDACLGPFEYVRPLLYSKEGEILLEEDNECLVWYDPDVDDSMPLIIRGMPDRIESVTYVESLISLNSGSYVRKEQANGKKKPKEKKSENKKNNLFWGILTNKTK